MHDAFDRRMRVVADRVGALVGRRWSSSAMSGTNCRAIGSCGSSRSISVGDRRRDRDRVARGDARRDRPSASGGARPAATSSRWEGGSSWRAVYCGSATGVHSTCSMRGAPVASITSRSKPSAMPEAGGICAERGEKILVDRIALAVHALLLRHLGSRSGGAARPRRSVRRTHSRPRRRTHKARSARRRADRARSAAPARPPIPDIRRASSRGRCRGSARCARRARG